MSLIPLRPVLEAASKYGYAQGAFNVNAVAQAKAVIEVHEMFRSTAILQGADLANGFMGGCVDFMNATLEDKKAGAKNIANAVKKIPVNAIEAVLENGIVLSGGGAELFGLDSMMAKVFEIPVTKANKPIDCVSKGLARINSFIPVKTRMNNKSITSMLSKYYNSKNQK